MTNNGPLTLAEIDTAVRRELDRLVTGPAGPEGRAATGQALQGLAMLRATFVEGITPQVWPIPDGPR